MLEILRLVISCLPAYSSLQSILNIEVFFSWLSEQLFFMHSFFYSFYLQMLHVSKLIIHYFPLYRQNGCIYMQAFFCIYFFSVKSFIEWLHWHYSLPFRRDQKYFTICIRCYIKCDKKIYNFYVHPLDNKKNIIEYNLKK